MPMYLDRQCVLAPDFFCSGAGVTTSSLWSLYTPVFGILPPLAYEPNTLRLGSGETIGSGLSGLNSVDFGIGDPIGSGLIGISVSPAYFHHLEPAHLMLQSLA